MSASPLGTETIVLWHESVKWLPKWLTLCTTKAHRIKTIAMAVSFRKTQMFLGICQTKLWGKDKASLIKRGQSLMLEDAVMIKDFLPDMVCLFLL